LATSLSSLSEKQDHRMTGLPLPMRPAISAAFVNHVLDVAEQHGCDGDWLLQQTGLSREQLSDSIVVHSHAPTADLAGTGGAQQRPAAFRSAGRRRRAPGTYGVLGYVLMTSATLGESLNMILRFGKIVYDSPSSQTRIVIGDGRVTLEDQRINELEPYCALHQETLMAGWAAFGRWLIASNSPMLEVRMRHPALGEPALYEAFLVVRCSSKPGAMRWCSPNRPSRHASRAPTRACIAACCWRPTGSCVCRTRHFP
jgi:hypothetical protein